MKKILFLSLLAGVFFISNQAISADATAGKGKYDTLCATCHGPTGVGDGVAAASLNPKPKNLKESTKTDAELKKIIKEGGASVGMSMMMPAWGTILSDADVDNVIAYIKVLKGN
jgi:mono/diheme cytochrome c family protein